MAEEEKEKNRNRINVVVNTFVRNANKENIQQVVILLAVHTRMRHIGDSVNNNNKLWEIMNVGKSR